MAGIMMPQKKQSGGGLMSLIGMGAGAALGGPGGAMAGASLGGQVGGMVGGLMGSGQSQGPASVGQGDSAMQRRAMAKQEDSLTALRDSVSSVQQLPDDLRKEYAKPLLSAYTQAAKERGVDPWKHLDGGQV